MKKINTLFTENTHNAISETSELCPSTKSQIARAAMSIGLSMIDTARHSMTPTELHMYIIGSEELDFNLNPKPLGSNDE